MTVSTRTYCSFDASFTLSLASCQIFRSIWVWYADASFSAARYVSSHHASLLSTCSGLWHSESLKGGGDC